MTNNKVALEDIVAIAKDARRFSSDEYQLLSSVVVAPLTATPNREVGTTRPFNDAVTFQQKLEYRYGL